MDKERKVYLKTKLRNLERKFSKIKEHPDLTEETLEIQKEINNIKKQLGEL